MYRNQSSWIVDTNRIFSGISKEKISKYMYIQALVPMRIIHKDIYRKDLISTDVV